MIRFPTTLDQLFADIDEEVPDWRQRATARTNKLVRLARWTDEFAAGEKRVTWSEVKIVYRNLQGQKCAYCERRLDSDPDLPTLGAQEHDLEHYRPKAKTIAWRQRNLYPDQYVSFEKKQGRMEGYYWLAFNLMNWCTSCKRCNSQLKGNRFPLALTGIAGSPTDAVQALQAAEKPLLLYPIGDIDDDPEDILAFHGVTVYPKHALGHKNQRAQAIIAFFLLNAKGIAQERALWLDMIWTRLEKESAGDAEAKQKVDEWLESTRVPHAAAVRAFIRLARADRAAAKDIIEDDVKGLMKGYR